MEYSIEDSELLEKTVNWLMTNPPHDVMINGISQSESGLFHLSYHLPVLEVLVEHHFAFPPPPIKEEKHKGGRPISEKTRYITSRWKLYKRDNPSKTIEELKFTFFQEYPWLCGKASREFEDLGLEFKRELPKRAQQIKKNTWRIIEKYCLNQGQKEKNDHK